MPKTKKVPQHVRKAIAQSGVKIPQMADLVSHFMEIAGGPKKLAAVMYEEFMNSKPGGAIRQRMMDSILRMMNIANSEIGYSEEIDLVTSEDLEEELRSLLAEMPDAEQKGQGEDPEEHARASETTERTSDSAAT